MGTDSDAKEQWVYHNPGLGGSGGSGYIDSVLLRDKDANATIAGPTDTYAWDEASDGTLELRHYLLQNWRFDVSVIVNSNGSRVIERIKYWAYGVPNLLSVTDADLDGDTDLSDSGSNTNRWNNALSAYDVLADFDLNGTIQNADLAAFVNDYANFPNGGRGQLSRTDTGSGASNCENRFGYAGYIWDPIIHKYLARNRWYDPEVGTWLRRDPLGYVDGANLFAYGGAQPQSTTDPLGLAPQTGAPTEGGPGDPPPPDGRDTIVVRCIDLVIPGARHCIVECCRSATDCQYYGLNPEVPVPPHGPVNRRPGGPLNPFNDPNLTPGYKPDVWYRGGSTCDCLKKANEANLLLPAFYYNLTNCNSNWYTSSLFACCTGWDQDAPSGAVSWGRSYCCTDDWEYGGVFWNDRRFPKPAFECPKGSPGAGLVYTRRCRQQAGFN